MTLKIPYVKFFIPHQHSSTIKTKSWCHLLHLKLMLCTLHFEVILAILSWKSGWTVWYRNPQRLWLASTCFSIGCSESARDRQLTTRQGFKVHPTWNSRSGTGKKGTNFNMYFVSDAHTCGNFPHMFKLPDLCSLQTCVCNCWYNFLCTWHCYTLAFAEAIWWLLPLGWRWLSVASASGR